MYLKYHTMFGMFNTTSYAFASVSFGRECQFSIFWLTSTSKWMSLAFWAQSQWNLELYLNDKFRFNSSFLSDLLYINITRENTVTEMQSNKMGSLILLVKCKNRKDRTCQTSTLLPWCTIVAINLYGTFVLFE